jgi:hypothetical protein
MSSPSNSTAEEVDETLEKRSTPIATLARILTASRTGKTPNDDEPVFGEANPLEPRTWSKRRKWYLSILLALFQLSVYVL